MTQDNTQMVELPTAAWREYEADFNGMTDEEIEDECRACRDQVDEAESWLEAVESWKAAGKPRRSTLSQEQQP
jgi:hypothetical protein